MTVPNLDLAQQLCVSTKSTGAFYALMKKINNMRKHYTVLMIIIKYLGVVSERQQTIETLIRSSPKTSIDVVVIARKKKG